MEKLPKIGLPIIIVIGALFLLISKTAVTIGPGEGGVLFERFGEGIVTDKTYGEGFQIVAPWNSMLIHKVRQQSISDEMNVLSVNGLEVKVNGTIWYEPEYENLGSLIKTKGEDYVTAIILGIFYKRMNKEGAIAGMIVGIVTMLYYMLKYKLGWFDDVLHSKSEWWFGISPEGFGSVAMLLNFIVSITIMKFTPPPPQEVQDIVERIRIPSGAGEATH